MYPINEIYGPVIQGEGPQVGTRTFFVRFAGCDYDCSWCDTKYAVSPKYPGWSKTMMSAEEIIDKLTDIGADAGDWITLSGGNPALFVDRDLAISLTDADYMLAMETQGSVKLKPWVPAYIASLVVSPKPPSSGMSDRLNLATLSALLTEERYPHQITALKYVIFGTQDLWWVREIDPLIQGVEFADIQRFLQPGTDIEVSPMEIRDAILNKLDWLIAEAKTDPYFNKFRILAQQHALLYGLKRGV